LERPDPLPDELLRQAAWTRRLARGLLGDESAAEDVLQETWESARRHPPQGEAPVEPWLRTVIRNQLLNRARGDRRRQAREQGTEAPAAADSPEELLAKLEIHARLVEAVARLPEPYRQTVLLRYFEELSSAEIAARLGVPAGTVRGRLKTALGELREDLDRDRGGRSAWLAAMAQLAGRGDHGAGVAGAVAVESGRVAWLAAAAIAAVAGGLGVFWAARDPEPRRPAPAEELVIATEHRSGGPTAATRPHAAETVAPPPAVAGTPVAAAPTPAPAAPGPARAGVGSAITGRVILLGVPAERPVPDRSSDPYCARQPRAGDEEVVVSANRGLASAAVMISRGGVATVEVPPPATLEVRGCELRPRLQVVRPGQTLVLRNADETAHAISARSGATRTFTHGLAAGTPPVEVTLQRSEYAYEIACDLHPWERAHLLVTDSSHVAMTDAEGRFTLPNVPPGQYTVSSWHPRYPHHRWADVTVAPGQTAEITVLQGDRPLVNGCTIALKPDSPVGQACKDGGIKKAKMVMKSMVKRGKERGLKHDCDDCHRDEAAGLWALTKDAEEKFRKLLAVVPGP
jgi:RNA polymerase sigma factor (sigma-70 family)